MPAPTLALKEVFAEALRRSDRTDRAAYLDAVLFQPGCSPPRNR
jgi:hypothetical protein